MMRGVTPDAPPRPPDRPAGHDHHDGFDGLDLAGLQRRPGVKWRRAGPGGLSAWVADMDFPLAPAVAQRLHEVVALGDLGYPDWFLGTPLRAAYAAWAGRHWGWDPDPASVREVTDLIQAVQVAVHLATEPGDAVALHVPNYPPFVGSVPAMGRELVPLPLRRVGGRWEFDAAETRAALARSGARMLLLVNPHNPTGRVFTRGELGELAAIAAERDLVVVSDEIHADLVHDGHVHVPFASLSDDAAARTVTLFSASKAFNLAGLRTAVAHWGPPQLLERLDAQPSDLFGRPSNLGVEAALAAWTPAGEGWLSALRDHLGANVRRVVQVVGERLPGVTVVAPEGTYLMWLDVSGTGLGADAGEAFARAGVRLSPGADFGPGGEGFVRLNVATSAEVLEEILRRMGSALPR